MQNSPKQNPIVLMYHGIISHPDSIPNNREPGADLYDVSLDQFNAQMEFIKTYGYPVVRFGHEDDLGKKRNVVMTFDDGESNNFDGAFAVLRKFGFPAYFFVIVHRIGRPGYMSWEMLHELIANGMIIGSHGLSHAILTQCTNRQIEEEFTESKSILEKNLNSQVNDFSVPRGFYNARVIEAARRAGYKNIFISTKLTNEADHGIERIAIKRNWTMERFQQSLEGRVSLGEIILDLIKTTCKKFFGGAIYNRIRNKLLGSKL